MTHKNGERGEINLTELLTAIKELPWQNEHQLKAMIQALGFNWEKARIESFSTGNQPRIFDRHDYRRKQPLNPDAKDVKGFSLPPAPEPVTLPKNIINCKLNKIESEATDDTVPLWLQSENSFLTEEQPPEKVARNDLFPQKTSRGVLGAALQVKTQGRAIDLPLLINQTVKGVLPKELPRLPMVTLQRGCQLLLDYSDSMVPFWEDLTALAEQLQDLVGKERVSIYEFERKPLAAKSLDISGQSKPWGIDLTRPVIVASDLGVGGQRRSPAAASYWLAFICRLEQNKVPLLLLNPWQELCWPNNLGKHPIQIHWNPRTTAAMVKQCVGAGHKIG